jgi:hypothetical protein
VPRSAKELWTVSESKSFALLFSQDWTLNLLVATSSPNFQTDCFEAQLSVHFRSQTSVVRTVRKVGLIVGLDLRQARFYLKVPSLGSKLIFQGFGPVITAAGSFVMS